MPVSLVLLGCDLDILELVVTVTISVERQQAPAALGEAVAENGDGELVIACSLRIHFYFFK